MKSCSVTASGIGAQEARTLLAERQDTAASAGPRVVLAVLLVAVVSLASGCAQPVGQPESPEAVGPVRTPAVTAPRGTPPVEGSLPRLSPPPLSSPVSPDALVAQATTDAARRAGVQPDAVRVELVEARAWPDRSLGCPQPGMGYAQSITPGYLIVVEVGGQQYRYHTDHALVEYCDAPL